MTDDRQDFVPIEPTPAVAPPAQPAGAVPPPPPGYYNPMPPSAPQYTPGQYPGQPAAGPAYPSYQPGGYPAGQYATYAPPPPPSGLAITSMILGIAGVLFSFFYGFGVFPAVAAVITGHLARKRQPHARGMWMAGLITGYIAIGISLLFIAGIIVFVIYVANAANQYSNY